MLVPLSLATFLLTVFDSPWVLPVFMVLVGFVVGGISTVSGALWAELYGTRHLGAIRAPVTAAMVFSTALAPGLIGVLLDAGVGFDGRARRDDRLQHRRGGLDGGAAAAPRPAGRRRPAVGVRKDGPKRWGDDGRCGVGSLVEAGSRHRTLLARRKRAGATDFFPCRARALSCRVAASATSPAAHGALRGRWRRRPAVGRSGPVLPRPIRRRPPQHRVGGGEGFDRQLG